MIVIHESKDELGSFLSRLRFNFMYEEFYDSFFFSSNSRFFSSETTFIPIKR